MSENMQQEFPAYYTALCARVADAIDALEQQNYGAARDALISGMQEQTARILGVSQVQISRLERRGLADLRQLLDG